MGLLIAGGGGWLGAFWPRSMPPWVEAVGLAGSKAKTPREQGILGPGEGGRHGAFLSLSPASKGPQG